MHAERAALIRDLEPLDEASWQQQSLCAEWTVHDVVAHLVDTARTTRLGFVIALARARFDFDRQNTRGVERERGSSPRETQDRPACGRHPNLDAPGAVRQPVLVEEIARRVKTADVPSGSGDG